ncbi:MAG TPA: Gfo/Idh/MocA family oxidoreductase [Candidatus Binataceae bacterium]|nr:Gfo/Idh/MocA family oxidoreductase [Candidatus Binataceae bacterium]HVA82223.1 Gfo/Idh/MocA family oxidoreductase [Candidatus Binataceae bacterium]
MKPTMLRIGLLGAARIAPEALIKPARLLEDVVVSAIAARDPARAAEFAKKHGIERVCASYDDLINDPALDAIYNPLPNSLHCEWTIRALRAGKHVLCEKPLASNAAEAQRMAEAADQTGRLLIEAFHYHYHPLAARIREILGASTLGTLKRVEGTFSIPFIAPTDIRHDLSLGGGATMDLGCYPLHMIRHFSGLTPVVKSARAQIGAPGIDVAMEAELALPGGAAAHMSCSMETTAPMLITFAAHGERGSLSVTNPLTPHRGHQMTLKTAAGESVEKFDGDSTYTYQLRAFAAAVRGGPAMPTDGHDGVISMRIIDDVYRKAGLPPRGA